MSIRKHCSEQCLLDEYTCMQIVNHVVKTCVQIVTEYAYVRPLISMSRRAKEKTSSSSTIHSRNEDSNARKMLLPHSFLYPTCTHRAISETPDLLKHPSPDALYDLSKHKLARTDACLYSCIATPAPAPLNGLEDLAAKIFSNVGNVTDGITVREQVPATGAVAVVVEPRAEDEV
jgi:hypothetical protein